MDVRFGQYRIIRELAQGTLTTVYQAVHEGVGRKVAIKALKPTLSPSSSFAGRLEREARMLAELSHPNVVVLFDFVKSERELYLVMEYLRGFTLAEVVGRRPKLRPEAVATIGVLVARALAHAHERGIIHRDVKPGNVMLLRGGGLKLVDFGIAQRERMPAVDEPIAGPDHEAFGTPAYMAPEQILGDAADARSDVYSLGVVLYQLACGARPFEKDGKAMRTRREPPVPLHVRAPDVERSLERIVMHAIERHPADRTPTAHALATDLEAFLVERDAAPTGEIVRRTLASARLVPETVRTPPLGAAVHERTPWHARAWSFFPLTLAVVLGGAVTQLGVRGRAPSSVEGPLALSARTGHAELRVLATPWADVAVDGQAVGTTPMARPIALAPGLHFVTFTHPAAPPVTRELAVEPNTSVVLDVTMDVAGANRALGGGDGG